MSAAIYCPHVRAVKPSFTTFSDIAIKPIRDNIVSRVIVKSELIYVVLNKDVYENENIEFSGIIVIFF